MSLCMDSLHPGILLKVQLRHRAEIVHRQFSQLFLEEVMVAVEKLRNKIAITQVELHKVDLYVTVFNAVQVQRWNHDVASSAPIIDSDPIAMEDIEEVNVEAKEEADYEAKEDISDRVTPNTTQLSPTGEEAHEGTSLTIETSAIYHKGITSTTSSQDHDDVSINTSTRVLRSSRRYTKSIMSLELPNVEQPSTPATELDEEYSALTHSSDDHYLDSDIETESSDDSTTGDYQYQLLRYPREAFYDAFTPYYESVKSSTKLIMNDLSVANPAIETTGETVPLVTEEESRRAMLHAAVAAETNAGTVPVVTKEDPRGELPDLNTNIDANLGEVDNDKAVLISNVEDPVTAEAANGVILASDDSTCDTLEKILNTKYTDELGTMDTRAVMPTVEYCQTPYRHGYVVKLPKTIDGFMISSGVLFDESLYWIPII
jgi:hypothetical protein